MNRTFRHNGYSAIELLLVCILIASIISIIIRVSNTLLEDIQAKVSAQQAYRYAQIIQRYISMHETILTQKLSDNSVDMQHMVTLSAPLLLSEHLIANLNSPINNLQQIPCGVIYSIGHKLQAMVYYRDNGNTVHLSLKNLYSAWNQVGISLGIYHNNVITSQDGTWNLNSQEVKQLFITQGDTVIFDTPQPNLSTCQGANISDNSYVVNVTKLLQLVTPLPPQNTLSRYPDILHQPDDPYNTNQMQDDLNLDATESMSHASDFNNQHNVIFKNNPDCPMQPTVKNSMQDYFPTITPNANPQGCKNKQLSITVVPSAATGHIVTITGFNQDGIPQNIIQGEASQRPYVGQVQAALLQPQALEYVGAVCNAYELGKIAKQHISTTVNDMNNIYVSQVVCMQSPSCTTATGLCYLPPQSLTIKYSPNTTEYQCPAGMFATDVQININNVPDYGRQCCSTFFGICNGYASSHNHIWDGYLKLQNNNLMQHLYAGQYLSGNGGSGGIYIPLPLFLADTNNQYHRLANKIIIGAVHYASTCDAVCQCPVEVRPPWQPIITSMICTNDPAASRLRLDQ